MSTGRASTGGDGPATPEETLDSLRRMLAAAEQRRRVSAAERELTITDVSVLGALFLSDLGPTQLAELVGVRTSSMTAALDRLEGRALVARRRGASRRSVAVSLTPAGRDMIAGIREPWLTAMEAMSPSARGRLLRSVAELTEVLTR